MSTSRYVPPTIRFGSLVFEHQENVDSQFDKAQRPDSIYIGTVLVNLSSGKNSIEQDSGSSLDLDKSEDEVHLVQDYHMCARS